MSDVTTCAKHGEAKTFRWERWRCATCERERNRVRDKTETRKEWRRYYQFLNSFKRNGQAQVRRAANKQRQLIAEGKLSAEPVPYSDFSIFNT